MKALILTATADPSVKAGVEIYSEQLQRTFPGSHIIGVEAARNIPLGLAPPIKEPMRALAVCRYVNVNACRLDADIIITHGMYGWALERKKLGIPVINVSHGTYVGLAAAAIPNTSLEHYRSGIIYAYFEKKGMENADVVVSNSMITHDLDRINYGVESKVIYNSIDTALFRPVAKKTARKKLGLELGKRIGLFVGRQEHQKGFDVLERIAKEMPGTDFISVTFPRTQTSAANIIPAGPLGREELALHYCAADFLVFPSRFEGFGFVIAESLACNTPVVSSNVGIAREISPEGLFVVKSFEPNDWVGKIGQAIDAKGKATPRKFIEKKFSEAIFCKKFTSLAKSLRSARKGAGEP